LLVLTLSFSGRFSGYLARTTFPELSREKRAHAMCDDLTERDTQRWLAEKRLGRREFSALGVSATAALFLPGCGSDSSSPSADTAGTTSSLVKIETPDGSADAFFVHPQTGSHPAILIWPDILGLRDAFKMMATRLAASGYAVLVINQYYRTSPAPVLSSWDEWMSADGKAKLQPNLDAITSDGISSDGGAMIDWLDKQGVVDKKKKAGTGGYCMGGPFTFRTAASRPERVGALASLHGASLVTDAADSPHLLIAELESSMLIAIAQNDDQRQPDAKTALKDAADAAKLPAEVEVYPAMHGWCPPDSPSYDETQAEKAWTRMLALFGEHL
jgi:carboxymethylenebutenolidase